MRYLIVGGSPFTEHTGTTTYTALGIMGRSDSLTSIQTMATEKYESCNGLLVIIDTQTGEIV